MLALGLLSVQLARGLEPYAGPITDTVRAMFGKIFESRGRYAGTPWPASAPARIFRKLVQGYGAQPMLRTGT